LPTATTDSLRVAQLIARLKPFVADFNVPIADGHNFEDLSFVVSAMQARVVIQILGSKSPIDG
jgi:hypothetical protein